MEVFADLADDEVMRPAGGHNRRRGD